MARLKLPRESYIPKGSRKVSHNHSDAVAYVYTNRRGKPSAAIFFGTQAKPVAHFSYRSEEAREKSVTEYFERRQQTQARVTERRSERKAFVHTVQVGDIFRTSWGYDQTNVEFFEVTQIRGKHAVVREIQKAADHRGSGSDYVVPQSGAYVGPRHEGDDRGAQMRRLIQYDGYKAACIKIDECRTAYPWGERIAGVVIGRPVYETASGWGH